MSFLSRLIVRLRGLVRRDVVAGEIHDELAFHLEMRIEEYERQGLSPGAARKKALDRVGNVAVHQDRGYDVRGGGVFETIVQDVKYALRLFRKQPGFAATAILTLALGIGVSTALFSVIDAALLHPLPFPHPEQLVEADITVQREGRASRYGPSINDAHAWRTLPEVTAAATVRNSFLKTMVDPGSGPERVMVNEAGDGYLAVCGIAPLLGRDIAEADVASGAPPVVLISHSYWLSHFNGDAGAIGRSIRFPELWRSGGSAGVATIIGVLPRGFYPGVAMWRSQTIALPTMGPERRGLGNTTILRLRAGVTLADATRVLSAFTAQRDPGLSEDKGAGVQLSSLLEETTGGYAATVNTLAAAVALILVIGCVNVAGLLLARGATRRPEFAIRASIGAGRWRLVRQLLTESLVLAVAAGATGVLLAWLSLDGLVSLVPLRLPVTSAVTINGPVLMFALALSVFTSLFFGLVPAFSVSRVSVASVLGGGGRYGSSLSGRMGQLLIGVEVALAVVLVVAAGLMINSFARASAVDLGFDPAAFVVMEAAPVNQNAATLTVFYPSLFERIRAIPGVAEASASESLPMSGSSVAGFYGVDKPGPSLISRKILPGYPRAFGQRLIQGREPSAEEIRGGTNPVLINETAAKSFFQDAQPIGRILRTYCGRTLCDAQVAGVVSDVRQDGPLSKTRPEVLEYLIPPMSKALFVVVRPAPGARVSADALRQAAIASGPNVFVERIRSGTELMGQSVITQWNRTLLFGLLGGLGLVLTLVGIFGITAYAVTRRTSEMAVRMAFGAQPGEVVRQVVVSSMWPAVIGTFVGLGAAYLSAAMLKKFLFQVSPTDSTTLAIVSMLVAVAAGFAAWLPARRAARVDPVKVLREAQ